MFLKKLSLIMFLLLLGTQVYSQNPQTIMECMNNALGKQYQKDIKTQKIEMSMSMMGMDMPMTMITTMPNKYRVEMSIMGMNIVTVVTPDDCFMIQNGNVSEFPAGQCEKAKEQMDEQNMFTQLGKTKKGDKIEYDGTEVVNGINCNKLKVTSEDGNVGYFFIGAEDCLMHKFTAKMNMGSGEQDVEMIVKEYKTKNNMKIPHEMSIMSDGEEMGKMSIKNIEFNIPIDDKLYKRP
jgi:hypothetical protein